ncbi:hypothetical protein SynBIOSE41_01703 [Synechococcus sp. BIOS-E4-1]|nr:hypothetical protein SynBIOSE41_01703 [Synechococcus sp. BIOS-E4-1]
MFIGSLVFDVFRCQACHASTPAVLSRSLSDADPAFIELSVEIINPAPLAIVMTASG